MKSRVCLSLAACLATALVGCGQKGPLVMPDAPKHKHTLPKFPSTSAPSTVTPATTAPVAPAPPIPAAPAPATPAPAAPAP